MIVKEYKSTHTPNKITPLARRHDKTARKMLATIGYVESTPRGCGIFPKLELKITAYKPHICDVKPKIIPVQTTTFH